MRALSAGLILAIAGASCVAGGGDCPTVVPTTRIEFAGNLRANRDEPRLAPFDPSNVAATSNVSTSVQVLDSVGQWHTLLFAFTKVGDDIWEWHALNDTLGVGAANADELLGMGELRFDESGRLNIITNESISFDPRGVAAPAEIAINFGRPLSADPAGSGDDGIVQQSMQPSALSRVAADGSDVASWCDDGTVAED